MNRYDPIARYYDLEHDSLTADIEMYLELLHCGPVLEVGSGTGRVAVSLARSGLEVWGVESSEAMLERARERAGSDQRVHYVLGSALDLDLPQQFAAAIVPLNGLWHFARPDEQVTLLRILKRHLRPDGILVVDLSNPLTIADRGSAGELRMRFSGDVNGAPMTCLAAAWDDAGEQLLQLQLIFDEAAVDGPVRRTLASLELHYIFKPELELLLRLGGFGLRDLFGSHDLQPFSAESPSLIAVAVPSPGD